VSPKKQDRRKALDPGGCRHIILPGQVCMTCWATIPAKEAKRK
jgi:hypothetical protein